VQLDVAPHGVAGADDESIKVDTFGVKVDAFGVEVEGGLVAVLPVVGGP
jgi:hypothetical protein